MILSNRATTVNENDGLPLPKRYWAILATALGVGMSVIDGTIANVALPTIARDLGTSPSITIWVVNAYQLAITISLLSFSSLGDIYGYRRIYLSGILLFSITSAICALADSFWMLTAARILQGFGAAAITSVNTALLRIIYPKRFLGRGMGINALVVARIDCCRTYNRFNHSLIGFLALAFCHQYPDRNCCTRNRTNVPA